MSSLLDLIVISLAAWRLAYLLVREDAPFRMMARLRSRTKLGGLLDCIYCCSIWTAAAAFTAYRAGEAAQTIVFILAASGLGLMLGSYTGAQR